MQPFSSLVDFANYLRTGFVSEGLSLDTYINGDGSIMLTEQGDNGSSESLTLYPSDDPNEETYRYDRDGNIHCHENLIEDIALEWHADKV